MAATQHLVTAPRYTAYMHEPIDNLHAWVAHILKLLAAKEAIRPGSEHLASGALAQMLDDERDAGTIDFPGRPNWPIN